MSPLENLAYDTWCEENLKNPSTKEALREILNDTPNVSIALQILLGLYKPSDISLTPINPDNFPDQYLISFESFNKYTGVVTYRYCKKLSEVVIALKEGPLPEYVGLFQHKIQSKLEFAKENNITLEEVRSLYTYVVVDGPINERYSHTGKCPIEQWMDINW